MSTKLPEVLPGHEKFGSYAELGTRIACDKKQAGRLVAAGIISPVRELHDGRIFKTSDLDECRVDQVARIRKSASRLSDSELRDLVAGATPAAPPKKKLRASGDRMNLCVEGGMYG